MARERRAVQHQIQQKEPERPIIAENVQIPKENEAVFIENVPELDENDDFNAVEPADVKPQEMVKKEQEWVPKTEISAEKHGWKRISDRNSHPGHNGQSIWLRADEPKSESTEGATLGFLKKTRSINYPVQKWMESWVWVDHYSGQKIPFDPKWWRERF